MNTVPKDKKDLYSNYPDLKKLSKMGNTKVCYFNGLVEVFHYSTNIFEIDLKKQEFSIDPCDSVSTKSRINKLFKIFSLPFTRYTVKGTCFISKHGSGFSIALYKRIYITYALLILCEY